MIKSFKDCETELIFKGNVSKSFPYEIQRAALRKLMMLDVASSVNDLRVPPGNRLEQLEGDRKGQYSIRVNDKYRICFVFKEGEAFDVEMVDYH